MSFEHPVVAAARDVRIWRTAASFAAAKATRQCPPREGKAPLNSQGAFHRQKDPRNLLGDLESARPAYPREGVHRDVHAFFTGLGGAP